MTSLDHPQLSGLGRNPAAPQDVLVRRAAHAAGRHGISLLRGRLAHPGPRQPGDLQLQVGKG